MTALVPTVEEITRLLSQMSATDWPTTEQERQHWFQSLGLTDLDTLQQRADEPDTTSTRFDTSLSGLNGAATMFRQQFLGLTLRCYDEPLENGPLARAGFAGLDKRLTHDLGPAADSSGTSTEPSRLWLTGALMVEMYCFQRLRSGVMIGLSHATRVRAHDATYDTRSRPPMP